MRLLPADPARRGKVKLLLAAAIFVLPLLGAWLAHRFGWAPGTPGNYGELLPPRGLPEIALERDGRAPATLAGLRGRWILVTFDASPCPAACERKLYLVRQARRALGQDSERVERLWMLTDAARPAPALLEAIAGAYLARFDARFARAFAAADLTEHIYLVDPRGQLMMRFPSDADPSRLLKDLRQLLRYTAS